MPFVSYQTFETRKKRHVQRERKSILTTGGGGGCLGLID